MLRIKSWARFDGAKREKLIEAAIEEFAERGFEGASYNRIIERAGLSKGTVYYYFGNKESLLYTVVEDICKNFIDAVGEVELPTVKERYWDFVLDHHRKVVNFFVENPLHGQVIFRLSSLNHFGEERLMPIHDRSMAPIDRMIERGRELGAVRSDLSLKTIRLLMTSIRRALNQAFLEERGLEGFNKVKPEELRHLMFLLHDCGKRILTPKEVEDV